MVLIGSDDGPCTMTIHTDMLWCRAGSQHDHLAVSFQERSVTTDAKYRFRIEFALRHDRAVLALEQPSLLEQVAQPVVLANGIQDDAARLEDARGRDAATD